MSFVHQELAANTDAELTLAFGHHPVTDTGESGDTWLFYGRQESIADLDACQASAYGYGHTDANADTQFAGNACTVPNASTNTVRALVFDVGTINGVSFQVGAAAVPMTRVAGNHAPWSGAWDASALAPGDDTITVTAVTTSGTRSHAVTVEVAGASPNQPPVAAGDGYSTRRDAALTVPAAGVLANDSDPEGTALAAILATSPSHGTLATFGTDGSFTCVPASGYVGTDTFTYAARDAGGLGSTPATVTVTIASPDTVTVKSALYTRKTKELAVTATGSAQPGAALTVVGYGSMTWNARSKVYRGTYSTPTAPATVTVTSSLGGSASLTVTVKQALRPAPAASLPRHGGSPRRRHVWYLACRRPSGGGAGSAARPKGFRANCLNSREMAGDGRVKRMPGPSTAHGRRPSRRVANGLLSQPWRPGTMSDVDLIIRELEWRRLRQRLVSNPFRAMLLTIATWTIVAVLKPVAR